jgi:hypothetical protein
MRDLLVDFAASGRFGPIQLDLSPENVRELLGEPWREGQGRTGYLIWGYGALELYFGRGESSELGVELFRVRFDAHDERLPSLFPQPQPVSFFDFCAAAGKRGVTVQTDSPLAAEEVRVRVPETGVSAIFTRDALRWIGIGRS